MNEQLQNTLSGLLFSFMDCNEAHREENFPPDVYSLIDYLR